MEAAKPLPDWAVKAADDCLDYDVVVPAAMVGDVARLLVSTREAALREAARYAWSYVDSQDVLALIPLEPHTNVCATCGSMRPWYASSERANHYHRETCPYYMAPPTPPPEIPWVRIT